MEAKMIEGKAITLYLSSWQKRMVRDYVKDFSIERLPNKIMISIIDKKQWVMYRQPELASVKEGAWNLYLTDEQIYQIAEVTGIGVEFSALNITPTMMENNEVAFG